MTTKNVFEDMLKSGKSVSEVVSEKFFSNFIGQIMKETEGRLNLQTLNKVLRKRLLNE